MAHLCLCGGLPIRRCHGDAHRSRLACGSRRGAPVKRKEIMDVRVHDGAPRVHVTLRREGWRDSPASRRWQEQSR
ncbi:hypothetical protein F3J14_08010 [Burkholderia sp. Tr-862]|nr:hypothetical protein [Burkholderia sp. Tr-862]